MFAPPPRAIRRMPCVEGSRTNAALPSSETTRRDGSLNWAVAPGPSADPPRARSRLVPAITLRRSPATYSVCTGSPEPARTETACHAARCQDVGQSSHAHTCVHPKGRARDLPWTASMHACGKCFRHNAQSATGGENAEHLYLSCPGSAVHDDCTHQSPERCRSE